MSTNSAGKLYTEPITKQGSKHLRWIMVQVAHAASRVKNECSFNTIFGSLQGHRIFASRKVAEKIEIQARYAAKLYNVDVISLNISWPI